MKGILITDQSSLSRGSLIEVPEKVRIKVIRDTHTCAPENSKEITKSSISFSKREGFVQNNEDQEFNLIFLDPLPSRMDNFQVPQNLKNKQIKSPVTMQSIIREKKTIANSNLVKSVKLQHKGAELRKSEIM